LPKSPICLFSSRTPPPRADADANTRAAYAKKLLEIDPSIDNITLDSIANAKITSHRQLFAFMMKLPLQAHVAEPAVQQIMRALASQGFIASLNAIDGGIVKCKYHYQPVLYSLRSLALVDSPRLCPHISFALAADEFGQQPPTALAWMDALGISEKKEWMVKSAGKSSFISINGKRRDVPTNKSKVSAHKNEAARQMLEIQKGLDALFEIIPLYLDAAAFAEIGDKLVARRADDKKDADNAANTSTVKKQRIREAAAAAAAVAKLEMAAALADLDGASATSILLAATAAEDDADGIEDRRRDDRMLDDDDDEQDGDDNDVDQQD
jgi:hypothetical protein